MANYTFSFIGTGSMGSALAAAASRSLLPEDMLLSNRTRAKAEDLAERLGCAVGTVPEAAALARYVFLGVKPQMMAGLFADIGTVLSRRTDRFTMERVAELAGRKYPIIRIMPNTPCAIGEGVVLYDASEEVTQEELDFFVKAMSGAGLLFRWV